MNDEIIDREVFSPDGKQVLQIYLNTSDDGFSNPRDPRDEGNIAILYFKDRIYGDSVESLDDMDDEEVLAYIENIALVQLPIYMMNHSGISIQTTPFKSDPRGWDSGLAGVAYTTKEKLEAIDMGKLAKDKEKLEKYVAEEVKTYGFYLEGEVYNWSLFDRNVCDEGHIHLEEVNSCNGYLGDDGIEAILDENGAKDWAEEEVKLEQKEVQSTDLGR